MSEVVYGYPGVTCDLQSTTTLSAPSWQMVTNVTLPGPFLPIDGLGLEGASACYRVLPR